MARAPPRPHRIVPLKPSDEMQRSSSRAASSGMDTGSVAIAWNRVGCRATASATASLGTLRQPNAFRAEIVQARAWSTTAPERRRRSRPSR